MVLDQITAPRRSIAVLIDCLLKHDQMVPSLQCPKMPAGGVETE